ncbi:hypothetical protein WI697_18485 [Tistrella mobilis]|uniref:hypothetical protein n=1 Tax=Tistrella mobilis TaxID=171437 RepID=UPI0031F71B89
MDLLDKGWHAPSLIPLDSLLGLHPAPARRLYSGPVNISAAESTAFAKINGPLEGNGRFYQRPDIY